LYNQQQQYYIHYYYLNNDSLLVHYCDDSHIYHFQTPLVQNLLQMNYIQYQKQKLQVKCYKTFYDVIHIS